MKNIVILFLVVFSSRIGSIVCEELVLNNDAVVRPALEVTIDCRGDFGTYCADCQTMALCIGESTPIYMTCGELFCNNGQCSSTKDPRDTTCAEIELEKATRCTAEGYFPNPKDCTKYIYCNPSTSNQVYQSFQCPTDYVFNSLTTQCAKKKSTKDCVTLQCTAVNTFILYPGNANYYGFCKSLNELIMYKCPTGLNFNLSTYACEFKCTTEGYFPAANNNQYYFCHKSGSTLIATLQTCPVGYVFNTTTKICASA